MELLEITQNIDDPEGIVTHTGPIRVARSVTLLRVAALRAVHGSISFDGDAGSMLLQLRELSSSDPRDRRGEPDDAFHLGGVTGSIGIVSGAGLQRDLGKIGRGTRDLLIGTSIGSAVAMEKPQTGGGAAGDAHQDGWQVMEARRVTFETLNYYGGPNTNHAALYCSPNKQDADETDSTLVCDVVAHGGTIVTKAAGVVLAACTRCGAHNLHIEAKYPWRIDKALTVDPVDVDNTKVEV